MTASAEIDARAGRRRVLIAVTGGALALALAGGLAVFSPSVRGVVASWSGTQRSMLAAGQKLYAQYCARCHGASLEGQPDWKRRLPSGRLPAPPHDATGHTWHHADNVLFELTKKGTAAVVGGGYESDMPGFSGLMADDEVLAVLAFIKSTWPERERRFQERVSQSEREAKR